MKKELIPTLLLTLLCILFFSGIYPLVIWAIAQFSTGHGEGFTITDRKGKVYYEQIAQKFTDDKYFWSRPSAVGYNAAGSGGSNKGPDNPDYLLQVQATIDTFLKHNPGVQAPEIPSDLVTASGSGLDPDISVMGAEVQVARVARARGIDKNKVEALIRSHTESPMMGMGPAHINVLRLNIDLENIN